MWLREVNWLGIGTLHISDSVEGSEEQWDNFANYGTVRDWLSAEETAAGNAVCAIRKKDLKRGID